MPSPATFNRNAFGRLWNVVDLPVEWVGHRILMRGDANHDLIIELDEIDRIDWIAFSEAVTDFQKQARMKAAEQDGKLGKTTLSLLRRFHARPTAENGSGKPETDSENEVNADTVLRQFSDFILRRATAPVCQPKTSVPAGHTPEERSVCFMWNSYGGAIAEQAAELKIPVESALGVFYVESKKAFDPVTGLVILRYEPHVFRRKSMRDIPAKRGGQSHEWLNFERAYDVHPEAALLACSYGLPQLMGFNFGVTRHKSPRDMVLAFQDSCSEQVAGFFAFVKANKLAKSIIAKDWRAFARVYNGPSAVDDYSGKLNRAMNVISSLKQDGAEFTN